MQFPQGSLQFEIGVQTWNPRVSALVSRRQNYSKIQENFKFLREHTGVHTHADLIVGLPGENFQSFREGFNALVDCGPDEIQVGILKRLKGAPLVRHEKEFKLVYSSQSPFQLLQNVDLDFVSMQKLHRFSRFWDQVANSGHFLEFTQAMIHRGQIAGDVFEQFWKMSEFLSSNLGQSHSVSRQRLKEALIEFSKQEGDSDLIQSLIPSGLNLKSEPSTKALPPRQRRHQTENQKVNASPVVTPPI